MIGDDIELFHLA